MFDAESFEDELLLEDDESELSELPDEHILHAVNPLDLASVKDVSYTFFALFNPLQLLEK